LDTDRLLIRGPGAILNSYAGARWTDNAPEVFDTLIRTALEDSGRFSRVASGRSGGLADWTLDLELRAFFAVLASESSPPTIEIELRGYLQCADAEVPIRIANRAPVAQATLTAIVEGFQSAVDSSLRELLGELSDSCTGR
jgi:cholesterol transport system auxiliary component